MHTNLYQIPQSIRHYREIAMDEVSVLVGGKAGDGISNAGGLVAQVLNHLGYFVYMYTD